MEDQTTSIYDILFNATTPITAILALPAFFLTLNQLNNRSKDRKRLERLELMMHATAISLMNLARDVNDAVRKENSGGDATGVFIEPPDADLFISTDRKWSASPEDGTLRNIVIALLVIIAVIVGAQFAIGTAVNTTPN